MVTVFSSVGAEKQLDRSGFSQAHYMRFGGCSGRDSQYQET